MKTFSLSLFAILLSAICFAQKNTYNSTKGIAIKGYDPVAYFLQNKAIEGSDQFVTEWSGSKWKFSTQANLDSFKLAPQKYAPQYGGYCAYGCSENHKAPTDPTAWTIVNNKLYLNYNSNVKSDWIKDTTNRIRIADKNWPVLNQ
ncbi:MAG: YHS domain-containing (seleno)protein [Ferruginibacter sp.]